MWLYKSRKNFQSKYIAKQNGTSGQHSEHAH